MPAPSLKAMAKEAGISMKDAEKYWDEATKAAGEKFKEGSERYYKYAMGIVKKRMGMESFRDAHADSLAEGVISSMLAEGDQEVRIYRDLNGEISFATMDDVHIDPYSDPRTAVIHKLATDYEWPHNHEFPECLEGYEGSLDEIVKRVLQKLGLDFAVG